MDGSPLLVGSGRSCQEGSSFYKTIAAWGLRVPIKCKITEETPRVLMRCCRDVSSSRLNFHKTDWRDVIVWLQRRDGSRSTKRIIIIRQRRGDQIKARPTRAGRASHIGDSVAGVGGDVDDRDGAGHCDSAMYMHTWY